MAGHRAVVPHRPKGRPPGPASKAITPPNKETSWGATHEIFHHFGPREFNFHGVDVPENETWALITVEDVTDWLAAALQR